MFNAMLILSIKELLVFYNFTGNSAHGKIIFNLRNDEKLYHFTTGTKQPQMLSYDIISENSQKISFLEIKIYLAKFKAITE